MDMDLRLKLLSYSSRLTLHSCPRKYQLYKLSSTQNDAKEESTEPVTFAFGTVVGLGVQELLAGKSLDETIWRMFLAWEPNLLADNPKQAKSFWFAVCAIQRFDSMNKHGLFKGWKLAEYKGKPAVELSFLIKFPNGFSYRGFVDVVLVHEETGAVRVVECKTTSFTNVSASSYKNSAQGIGYSIMLDALFPNLSSYEVMYLIYQTKTREYLLMPFKKDYLARALWIRELLLDIEVIEMYEKAGVYPMHGESCYSYFRDCEYLNLCTLSTEKLQTKLTDDIERELLDGLDSDFQIQLTIDELIKAQLAKE